jgi:hypothetical protein
VKDIIEMKQLLTAAHQDNNSLRLAEMGTRGELINVREQLKAADARLALFDGSRRQRDAQGHFVKTKQVN